MKILQLLSLCLFCTAAMAQPTEPILRIETGMHSATVRHISIDAAGKYLLTCSDDKTARLWNVNSGTLLRTLRVPIGKGDKGILYACALSPDGLTAAVGGWSGFDLNDTCSIYILDVQTGNIITCIKGLPHAITDLQFSPDGQWLASGIADKGGVWIIHTQNWKRYRLLDGYGSIVYGMAFSNDNRLATVSYDGKIRLYNSHYELENQVITGVGRLPHSITFHPNDSLLAIVYEGEATVEVRNANNLAISYFPKTTNLDIPHRSFCGICFSRDGTKLYSGGSFDEKGKSIIRIWDDAGKGDYIDKPVMTNTIMDIKSLPNNSMAVADAYPDIAIINADGKDLWYQTAENNNFGDTDKSCFRISTSGNIIEFTSEANKFLSFNVTNRKLSSNLFLSDKPVDTAIGTKVTDWHVSNSPKINKKKVDFFTQYETCFATDISNDGNNIAMGTGWNIYVCDNNGLKLWKTAVPFAIAVNISGNDKVVAAALGDGTIRWYSMADGKELLAFYLNSDKKRWVLWTPQGYYDASPGAEDFLGWHVNNGPDKTPDFYPVSRFRSKYYRPDVIDAIFKTFNEDSAIAFANAALHACHPDAVIDQRGILQMLPPVITITAPANLSNVTGSRAIIHYIVKNPPGATLSGIRVLVNGRPVTVERGLTISHSTEDDDSVLVAIPTGECRITLLAENSNGTSPAATITLMRKGNAATATPKKPNLYAVVVGVSNYDNVGYRLQYAASDAAEFSQSLKKQKGKKYEDVIVRQLLDKDATESGIRLALEWVQSQAGKDDVAMIFYAGHGMNESNHFYFLPADADVSNLYTCLCDTVLVSAVSHTAGKVVVFFDACHSGNALSNCSAYTDVNAMINRLMGDENGVVTFTSSTGREFSYEYPALKHGAFTKALLEGFSGKAAPFSDDITVKTLDAFTSMRVKQLTDDKQHPTMIMPQNLPDFGIGIK